MVKDERECNYLHTCGHLEFMCRDGSCLNAEKKCDGHEDCLDGTDERGCNPTVKSAYLASREMVYT
jgi:hypothetical protein